MATSGKAISGDALLAVLSTNAAQGLGLGLGWLWQRQWEN